MATFYGFNLSFDLLNLHKGPMIGKGKGINTLAMVSELPRIQMELKSRILIQFELVYQRPLGNII